MNLQNPVTRTSFEYGVAGRDGAGLGDLAALEALLAGARNASVPALRRLRLVATLGRRLDSLFQLYVPALRDAGRRMALHARVRPLAAGANDLLAQELLPALAERELVLSSWGALGEETRAALARLFVTEISPLLTPLTVDAGHPFPSVANLALNHAVLVRAPGATAFRYVGIEVPPNLPRFVTTADGRIVLCVEEIIGANLGVLLPGLEIGCHHVFRVTRDGRPRRANGAGAGPSPRTRAAVRLEIEAAAPLELRSRVAQALGLGDHDVYPVTGALDLCGLASLPVARSLRAAAPAAVRAPTSPAARANAPK
jgi:polyphosphate kinase